MDISGALSTRLSAELGHCGFSYFRLRDAFCQSPNGDLGPRPLQIVDDVVLVVGGVASQCSELSKHQQDIPVSLKDIQRHE
jgi:hypothetical protein